MPSTAGAFASAQAAWRFYRNPRINLPALMEPLLETGRQALVRDRGTYALVMHDWSLLHFGGHESKSDRVTLSQSRDWGYELQAAILVSSEHGLPLAPLSLSVRAADGVYCSRTWKVRSSQSPLDELEPVMDFVEQLRLAKPAVHIIDAEADSIGHYRSWLRTPGRFFVIRADDRVVQHEGEKRRFSEIMSQLWEQNAFRRVREITCRGRQAQPWVAEITVTMTNPARPQGRDGQPRRSIPGESVTLRLVISQIRWLEGSEAPLVWFLLTNLPTEVDAPQVALWYYWRWKIESYFKLLKSAGQQIEQWQQETAAALARRLLIASMACVVVWQLAQDESPEAAQLRDILIRLSGRQMKRGCKFTMPALLAGLWGLLSMFSVLEEHNLTDLRKLAKQVLSLPRAGPNADS
ncbi:MAG: transposase [Pirellulaceae bacterium]